MKFKTTLLQVGKTATGFTIPSEIVEGLGAGRKPPVRITINGYTYRNTVAVMGGKYMVGVSAEHRMGAHVAGGDKMEVTIELDTEPREVEVPQDLQKALKKNSVAKQYFDTLSYSKKKGIVVPINEAKAEDTRLRRIEKAIALLNGKKV
jgi:hypothetical protein